MPVPWWTGTAEGGVFLLRARRSTVSTALIAAVFGFLLASTGVAPVVDSVLRGVDQAAHTLK
ncbi:MULTISPECIES: hypothetical protein [unclassified Kitasatospora]|uniref:hypothetical protein n=1 Tax=unclassified Kitasatospora TaxID=2633591 RepID=UPI00070D530B|nr:MULTISPECIES: hypothetical protein [unclassified Kitasatospora]KQV04401.1 hypothetical protein ASC99_13345 [Kitasatospora sp. Root107]KRB61068.1 hypothetical protein ASE03_12150 [Kitasatospora sp. Root187]